MNDRERILDIQARQRLARHYREQREAQEEDVSVVDTLLTAIGILGAASVIGGAVILIIMMRWV